jgi:hypothetical protein
MYNRRKKKSYEIYEEDISYNKETTISANTPSTKDNSLSQSSNSDSIKHSYTEHNSENIDQLELLNIEDTSPKINLSENELKTAYYKPKQCNNNTSLKKDININNNKDKDENIIILEINVRVSKDKTFNFKLRKYDDMFQVTKDACIKNEISEKYTNFFVLKIIKALNSIYGIYNLSLKEKEIKFLNDLKEKCTYV